MLRVQNMITKMRDIRISRAKLVGQFHRLSGFVYSRFETFNPEEMSDAYFSQYFRQPFIQLERIVGQIKHFKVVFGEMAGEISEVFKLMVKFQIEVDRQEFLELIRVAKVSINPNPASRYYSFFYGKDMEKLLGIKNRLETELERVRIREARASKKQIKFSALFDDCQERGEQTPFKKPDFIPPKTPKKRGHKAP